MRQLNGHQINPVNDKLTITVVDEPGSGGANHAYFIGGSDIDFDSNPGIDTMMEYAEHRDGYSLLFQNGPIAEAGVNGVTHEALLEILCDRLRGFQSGPYACADNAEALACMEQAQTALQRRTKERMARGVEGTHDV